MSFLGNTPGGHWKGGALVNAMYIIDSTTTQMNITSWVRLLEGRGRCSVREGAGTGAGTGGGAGAGSDRACADRVSLSFALSLSSVNRMALV